MFKIEIKAGGDTVGVIPLNHDQDHMMQGVQEGLRLLELCPLVTSKEVQNIEAKVIRRMLPTLRFNLVK